MAERIVSFVMSGGVGSRLWPLSREDNPKQFHDLSGDGSMLAKTLRRLKARPAGDTPIYLIASERHAERVRADIAALDLDGGGAIFEPVGRNTAAAVAIATLQTLSDYGDEALVLVVPSDHEISTDRQFWETVERGARRQRPGGSSCSASSRASLKPAMATSRWPTAGADIHDVSRFVEKPDLETARTYIARLAISSGTPAFSCFAPAPCGTRSGNSSRKSGQASEAAYAAADYDVSGLYMPLDLYTAIPSISIDYAIMEQRTAYRHGAG